jgi:hypothetical protein
MMIVSTSIAMALKRKSRSQTKTINIRSTRREEEVQELHRQDAGSNGGMDI